ncbi:hypothetical protein BD779DRAFT_1802347 [Infundibulicybe gibba]|nr:hypothetical protein BD779DRAFT_1802347 [Infundibulicybe gibba]
MASSTSTYYFPWPVTSHWSPHFKQPGVSCGIDLGVNSIQWMHHHASIHLFLYRDHYILKYAVAYIWFSCVTLALCEFWAIHDIIVAGYYLPSELVIISPGFPIGLAIGMTIGCTMKGIYIFRMYRFNHNRYLLVCCCVLVGLELGTEFTWVARVAHAIFAWQEAVLNDKSKWIITTFFTTSMVLDIFVAASTCYQLWRSRMIGFKRMRHLVDTLIRWTIRKSPPYLIHAPPVVMKETGILTSAVSLAIVLTKNLDKNNDSYLWLGICIFAPNCYAMGLLALLNARTRLDKLNTGHPSLPTITTSLAWARPSRSIGIPTTRSAPTGSTQRGHDA